MSTLTIARDRIVDDIRPGDYITGIDGTPLPHRLLVAGWGEVANRNQAGGIELCNRLETETEWYLYPDSHVAEEITVLRDHDERGSTAVVGRLVRGEIAATWSVDIEHPEFHTPPSRPLPRQEAPSAPEAPAQPKPKAKRTRRFGDLLLVSQANGEWKTEDGRHGVSNQRAGYTTCEGAHPVRISREMAANARERPTHRWALPIIEALDAGKRGYWCPGNQEHEGEWGWIPWSVNVSVDSAAHAVYGTLAEAGNALAKDVQQYEGGNDR